MVYLAFQIQLLIELWIISLFPRKYSVTLWQNVGMPCVSMRATDIYTIYLKTWLDSSSTFVFKIIRYRSTDNTVGNIAYQCQFSTPFIKVFQYYKPIFAEDRNKGLNVDIFVSLQLFFFFSFFLITLSNLIIKCYQIIHKYIFTSFTIFHANTRVSLLLLHNHNILTMSSKLETATAWLLYSMLDGKGPW